MKKKWFSALAALAVLSFAAAPMNGYAVDEESLDDELAVAVTTEAPVIAGTVVTTDTQMQTTSSSVYTTVTDEYGNGLDENGNVVLGDEMLTPDSSRFWPLEGYEAGKSQPSYDKQFVRDWLKANPDSDYLLPDDVIEKTVNKYKEAYELLTGKKFA